MALSANTAWEIRPTSGSDSACSGGFVAGASGTDWSQQNAAQYSLTGLTTAAANAIILSASASADMVGNIIQITGGTNFTVGFYQIISVSVGVSITVDRTCTSAAGAAGTAVIGGALKTLNQVKSLYVASNKIFCKAEATQTTAATLTFSTGGTPGNSAPPTQIIGYTSSRTDGGQFTVQLITNTGLTGMNISGNGIWLQNFTVDCNSLGTSTGIALGGFYCKARNCVAKNFTTLGISSTGGDTTVEECEITGGTSAATAAFSGLLITFSNIHDNACPGVSSSGSTARVLFNRIYKNTGASSDGVVIGAFDVAVMFNTIDGNGRDGIRNSGNFNINNRFRGNMISNHTAGGAAGIRFATAAGLMADSSYDGNGFYNNTTNRVNGDDTSSNPIDGVSPWTNIYDVLSSNDPYTNYAGNDLTLNATTSAGTLFRGTARFQGIPGDGGKISYRDFGCYQHQDSGGGGTVIVVDDD